MMTKALVANGATVYILGRRREVLEKAALDIDPVAVRPIVCDVTSKDSLQNAASVVLQEAGHINMLLCNAGVGGPQTPKPSPAFDMTLKDFATANWNVPMEDYTRTFEANTIAVWYTVMAFLMLLDAGNKKGNVLQTSQVITITSLAAFNKVRGEAT